MKLVVHIGMGKTGTSSIQKRLSESGDALRTQSACYLGMWFDMVDPKFKGLNNQLQFFALTPAELSAAGDRLHRHMQAIKAADGTETFIQSNESFSGKAAVLKPLLDRLIALGVTVKIIAYVRNPMDWLPSAYVQWGVRHKMSPGRIRPYPAKARQLLNWYNGLVEWHDQFGPLFEVRSYDDAPDVVMDFATAAGVVLPASDERVLERGESAEIVLRALFNDQFKTPVLPERFNRAVLSGLDKVPRISDVISDCLDYSETARIVEEHAAFFDRLETICGFDPRQKGRRSLAGQPDADAIKDRLLDALVEITLTQAHRIRRIEEALERQAQGEPLAPGSFPPMRRG